MGREPGEEGGVAALGHREGCGGGACLSLEGGKACLALPVSPCRVFEGSRGLLKPRAGSGRVTVQCGEPGAKRNCHTFMLGSG